MSSMDLWNMGENSRSKDRTRSPSVSSGPTHQGTDSYQGLQKAPGGGWTVGVNSNQGLPYGTPGSEQFSNMDELGFTNELPGDRTAQDIQYNSERAVAIRNAGLMDQAVNAIGDSRDMATGLLESYRPGGSASIASGIQMQAGTGMANMLAASRTQAPNLLFNWDERQRQMSRTRADRNMYIGTATQVATTAISTFGPGLFGGGAPAGTNVWDALSAGATAAGGAYVAGQNTGGAPGSAPAGGASNYGVGPDGKPVNQPAGDSTGVNNIPSAGGSGPQQQVMGPQQPGAVGPQQPGQGPTTGPTQPGQGQASGGAGPTTGGPGGGQGQPGGMGPGLGGPGGGVGPMIAGYNSGVPSALSATGQAPGTLGGQDPGDASGGRLLRDAQSQGRDSSVTMRANIIEYPDVLPLRSTMAYLDWMDSVFFGDLRKSNKMDASSFSGSSYSMQDQ